ncbi:hypothetical protein LZ30DRAFT_813576, partial [Colletotrichum cereale]
RPSLDPAIKRQTDILTHPSDTGTLFPRSGRARRRPSPPLQTPQPLSCCNDNNNNKKKKCMVGKMTGVNHDS